MYGAENWTLRAADQNYLESFEMWCWRRMEKISWTDHVRNEEVLLNLLKPNDIYICRNTALTSRRYILNIYSTNIHTEYFKHAA